MYFILFILLTNCRTIRNPETLLTANVNLNYFYTTEDDINKQANILKKVTSSFFKKIGAKAKSQEWKNSILWGDCDWNTIDSCEINYVLPVEKYGPIQVRVEISHMSILEINELLLSKDVIVTSYISEKQKERYGSLDNYLNAFCLYYDDDVPKKYKNLPNEDRKAYLQYCHDHVLIEYFLSLQHTLKDIYQN